MKHLTAQHLETMKSLNERLPSQHAMKLLVKAGVTPDDSSLFLLQLAEHGLESAPDGSYPALRPTLDALHRMVATDPERVYRRLTSNATGDSLMQPFVAEKAPAKAQQYLLGMLVA